MGCVNIQRPLQWAPLDQGRMNSWGDGRRRSSDGQISRQGNECLRRHPGGKCARNCSLGKNITSYFSSLVQTVGLLDFFPPRGVPARGVIEGAAPEIGPFYVGLLETRG